MLTIILYKMRLNGELSRIFLLNIAIFAQTYHRIDGRSKFYDPRKTTHAPPNAYEMSDQMLQNSAKVCYNKLHQVSWIK